MASGLRISACSKIWTFSPTLAKRCMKSSDLSIGIPPQIGEQAEIVGCDVVPGAGGDGGGVCSKHLRIGCAGTIPQARERVRQVLRVERIEELHHRPKPFHLLDNGRDA